MKNKLSKKQRYDQNWSLHRTITSLAEGVRLRVGLDDTEERNIFKFATSREVASIKAYGEAPVDDEDLFITWNNNEPNDYAGNEHYAVIVGDAGGNSLYFNDAHEQTQFRPLCERPNPFCHEGTLSFWFPATSNLNFELIYLFDNKLRHRVSWNKQRSYDSDTALFGR